MALDFSNVEISSLGPVAGTGMAIEGLQANGFLKQPEPAQPAAKVNMATPSGPKGMGN